MDHVDRVLDACLEEMKGPVMSNADAQRRDLASLRPSRLGKTSVILGLVNLAMMIFLGCVFLFGALWVRGTGDSELPYAEGLSGVVAPLGSCASPVVSLTGIGLAVAGLCRRNCRRGVAVVGLLLNAFTLSVFVLLCWWWLSALDEMIAC